MAKPLHPNDNRKYKWTSAIPECSIACYGFSNTRLRDPTVAEIDEFVTNLNRENEEEIKRANDKAIKKAKKLMKKAVPTDILAQPMPTEHEIAENRAALAASMDKLEADVVNPDPYPDADETVTIYDNTYDTVCERGGASSTKDKYDDAGMNEPKTIAQLYDTDAANAIRSPSLEITCQLKRHDDLRQLAELEIKRLTKKAERVSAEQTKVISDLRWELREKDERLETLRKELNTHLQDAKYPYSLRYTNVLLERDLVYQTNQIEELVRAEGKLREQLRNTMSDSNSTIDDLRDTKDVLLKMEALKIAKRNLAVQANQIEELQEGIRRLLDELFEVKTLWTAEENRSKSKDAKIEALQQELTNKANHIESLRNEPKFPGRPPCPGCIICWTGKRLRNLIRG